VQIVNDLVPGVARSPGTVCDGGIQSPGEPVCLEFNSALRSELTLAFLTKGRVTMSCGPQPALPATSTPESQKGV
jgi:hypothetical protein